MTADSFPDEDDKPFAQEGYALMGAAFAVHAEVGGGIAEEVYQESFERELTLRRIPFIAQQEIAIYYKGYELKKRYIPDLYVSGQIVVELKAVVKILPEHEGQLLNYMRLTRKPVGYLINFAPIAKVEWKRFVLRQFFPSQETLSRANSSDMPFSGPISVPSASISGSQTILPELRP
jgi:GxxExxY protein